MKVWCVSFGVPIGEEVRVKRENESDAITNASGPHIKRFETSVLRGFDNGLHDKLTEAIWISLRSGGEKLTGCCIDTFQ